MKTVYIAGKYFETAKDIEYYPRFDSVEDAMAFAKEFGYDTVFVCVTR